MNRTFLFVLVTIFKFNPILSLNVLGISSCFTGHLTPMVGIFRALRAKGHEVDVLMGADCCDSKVAGLFKNVSNCYFTPIFESHTIVANTQFEGLMNLKELFAENGTKIAFHQTHKFLTEHPDYDVIVSDYVLLGSYLAAELHSIPVVATFGGPFVQLLQHQPLVKRNIIYMPETVLPDFAVEIIGLVGNIVWHFLVSEEVYKAVGDIQEEFDMVPKIRSSGLNYGLPFYYFYMHTNLIHTGPPDVFLPGLEYLEFKTNAHHVGFIPDETSFKSLSPELESFLQKSNKPVVYMSLGTVFKIEVSKLEALLADFADQEMYSVIWAVSEGYEELKSKELDGGNVLLVTKIAQFSLLMLEKVQVFITHAGMLTLFKYTLNQERIWEFFAFSNWSKFKDLPPHRM